MMQGLKDGGIPNCSGCPYVSAKTGGTAFNGQGLTGSHHRTGDWMPEIHFCEKIGGMPCLDGGCGDAYQEESEGSRHPGRQRMTARERNRKYQRHLRKLASISERMQGKSAMYGGAVLVDRETGGARKKPFYRRYWRGSHNNRFRYWRRVSNRKVRRYKGDVHSGGFYRKISAYWWTVD